jgi:hypothetical protein
MRGASQPKAPPGIIRRGFVRMRHCEESGAIGFVSPCVGCGLHDVMNAATISNKLTIPENSDMAKLPPFRPARHQIYRNSLFATPPRF